MPLSIKLRKLKYICIYILGFHMLYYKIVLNLNRKLWHINVGNYRLRDIEYT